MTSAPECKNPFKRAVVLISLDTEQIWGYLDKLDEERFCARYPGAVAAADRLLDCLTGAGIRATWALVGALALKGAAGPNDPRLAGLPRLWTAAVMAGDETTAPLWYRHSFVRRLLAALPEQEVALHGGLTHLIWTDPWATAEVIRRELEAGLCALAEHCLRPRSFVFPRNAEAQHDLLRSYGFCCYRGRSPFLSDRLGRSFAGAFSRAAEELGCATPQPVWPRETLPGLWNIPGSLWLYPMGPRRARFIPLRTRLARVRRGVEAAIRRRGIFHLGLHPENLAESPHGFEIFQEILEVLIRARNAGDAENLTMAEIAERAQVWREGGEAVPLLPARARKASAHEEASSRTSGYTQGLAGAHSTEPFE